QIRAGPPQPLFTGGSVQARGAFVAARSAVPHLVHQAEVAATERCSEVARLPKVVEGTPYVSPHASPPPIKHTQIVAPERLLAGARPLVPGPGGGGRAPLGDEPSPASPWRHELVPSPGQGASGRLVLLTTCLEIGSLVPIEIEQGAAVLVHGGG